ncbi:hypothetical protein EROM_091960 [Encephalitozoon romaleae SJ-2008]|uniref:Uncharacterized protein n=1 Tax=Encephalitozoon romaleae (strain SJ-2008) TaxID=1178016 RepID=I7AGC3_ENCRO|nr:hypothetical protein EROM_091960 [Encephalitozoon romaleae SJ-2008]AFN83810.1 hypothetical protein EROM_091960 [Encephalitozoon romaleae SJ-2008]
MGANEEFISPLDLAKRLRSNTHNPSETLLSIQCLSKPLSINRGQVREIRRLSRFLFHLSVDKDVLVSLVFNSEAIDVFMDFSKITVHRVYDGIYYSVDIEM